MTPHVLVVLDFAAGEPGAAPAVAAGAHPIGGRPRRYFFGYRYIVKGATWMF